MQNINYTPLDVEKMKGIKSSNVNFYLLIIVTIAAAIFSVLLFIYIQQKNDKLNQISNTEEIIQAEPTQAPVIIPTKIPIITPRFDLQKISSGTPKVSTPTPSIKTTVIPTVSTKTTIDQNKSSSTSAN